MNNKEELKKRLEELEKVIISNSKDAHFAKKLVGDLISTKGQLDVEVTELDCGKKIDEIASDTYRITLTDKGVLYHEYGGYSLFATSKNTSIYETLADLVVNKEEYNALDEDRSKELTMSAIAYCLAAPKVAFLDPKLCIDIATRVVTFLNEQYDRLMNEPLQEETPKENEEFKEAVLAGEALKEAIKENE